MPETQRYHVHAALLATLESDDPGYDPIAQTQAMIAQIAIAASIRVKVMGDISAARFFKPGDSVQWSRPQPGGGTHEEFGRVVAQDAGYILEFADGQSIPLPVRMAPIAEIDQ